jgi:hypothetical protein
VADLTREGLVRIAAEAVSARNAVQSPRSELYEHEREELAAAAVDALLAALADDAEAVSAWIMPAPWTMDPAEEYADRLRALIGEGQQ